MIFVVTVRNRRTFELFETELKGEGICCSYVLEEVIYGLPKILPCYHTHPLLDVSTCTFVVSRGGGGGKGGAQITSDVKLGARTGLETSLYY